MSLCIGKKNITIGAENMSLGKGDSCYFIENGTIVIKGRISGYKNGIYFVQVVGRCGSLQLTEEQIFNTQEEAEQILERKSVIIDHFF